jgi:hypothetical protein
MPDAAARFPSHLKLPYAFDVDALAAEARAFEDHEWQKHFNEAYYRGEWSGIALRSPFGRDTILPDPHGTAPYADTPFLKRCPAVHGALRALGCETNSVRLLRLGPGASVLEHQDYNVGIDYGFVRLHVPVVTGPGVEFVLGGEALHFAAGECWYVDVWRPHRVANAGPQPRIHLVIDCVVEPALLAALDAARDAAAAAC